MTRTSRNIILLAFGLVAAKQQTSKSSSLKEVIVKVPKLNYEEFDVLEPFIDKTTLRLHYEKHFKNYALGYNSIITEVVKESSSVKKLAKEGIVEVLQNLGEVKDKKLQTALRNYGGGYLNHYLLFETLAPPKDEKTIPKPRGELMQAIKQEFKSFDKLAETMTEAALSVFGSGWAWLVLEKKQNSEKLAIVTTQNQDNPIMFEQSNSQEVLIPLMGIDMWEHAYYLKYHTNKQEYINAVFHIINWDVVEENFIKHLETSSTSSTGKSSKSSRSKSTTSSRQQEEEEEQQGGGFLSSIFGGSSGSTRSSNSSKRCPSCHKMVSNNLREQEEEEQELEEQEQEQEELQQKKSKRGTKRGKKGMRGNIEDTETEEKGFKSLVLVAPEDLYIFS